MDILFKKAVKGLIVSLMGKMDAVSAVDFDKEMNEQMMKGESQFILDLSRLDYISSAGLRSILSVSRKIKERRGAFVLCGFQGIVKEVFNISGFFSMFTIFDSLEDALKGLQ